MRRSRQLAILALLMLMPVLALAQGTLVDRVVAVVDGRIVTLDQWQQQERLEALMQNRSVSEVHLTEVSLNRLIDQILITKNLSSIDFTPAASEDVNGQLIAVRKQINGAETNDGWRHILSTYGLGEDEVKELIAEQMNTLRFIEARFRPGARITPEQVSAYYRDKFVPEFLKQAAGSKPPTLTEVTDRITNILTEQLMNQRFNSWLQNLRTQARLQRVDAPTQVGQPSARMPQALPH